MLSLSFSLQLAFKDLKTFSDFYSLTLFSLIHSFMQIGQGIRVLTFLPKESKPRPLKIETFRDTFLICGHCQHSEF